MIVFYICLIITIIFITQQSKLENYDNEINLPYYVIDDNIDFVHYGYYNQNNLTIYDAQLNLILLLLEHITIYNFDKILDVGCGTGGFIKLLNKKFNNLDIRGIEKNYFHYKIASKLNLLESKNKIQIINDDILNYVYDIKFNKIFAIECAFHFDKYKFLKKANLILENNGVIAIVDIVTTSKINKLKKYKQNINNIIQNSFGNFDSFWKPFDYKLNLINIGYKNIFYRDISKETFPSYDFLIKNSKKNTLDGIKLLEFLHKNNYLKYIMVIAQK